MHTDRVAFNESLLAGSTDWVTKLGEQLDLIDVLGYPECTLPTTNGHREKLGQYMAYLKNRSNVKLRLVHSFYKDAGHARYQWENWALVDKYPNTYS